MAEIDALAPSLIPGIRSQPVPQRALQAVQQLCLNLMGRGENPFLSPAKAARRRQVLPRRAARSTAWPSSILRHALEPRACTSGAATTPAQSGYRRSRRAHRRCGRHLGLQLVHLVNASSRIQVAPGDPSTRQAVRGRLALHRKWAASSPANYAAPFALLEGAWAPARGQP